MAEKNMHATASSESVRVDATNPVTVANVADYEQYGKSGASRFKS
jgi:hypothetical protein